MDRIAPALCNLQVMSVSMMRRRRCFVLGNRPALHALIPLPEPTKSTHKTDNISLTKSGNRGNVQTEVADGVDGKISAPQFFICLPNSKGKSRCRGLLSSFTQIVRWGGVESLKQECDQFC